MISRTLGLLVLLSSFATADEVTLVSDRDNTMYQSGSGSLSNGAGAYMFAGRTNNSELRRALVHFDVAGAVPAGSTVHSVRLDVTMSMTLFGPDPVSTHRVLADWGEGTSNSMGGGGGIGAGSTTGDATWIHTFYPGSLWANAGGDFAASPSDTQSFTYIPTPPVPGAFSSLAMVDDVQFWVDNPSQNFGWTLVGDETQDASAKRFDTREHADPTRRPQLVIHFTPSGSGALGVPFCFGDGSGAACPCGNESTVLCKGCQHSSGFGMDIVASGTMSVLSDDLIMTASECPPGNSGIFYCGQTALIPGNTLYDGIQCAGGSVRRFQGRFQAGGIVSDTGFVAQDPSGTYFVSGVAYNFQYWSRDVAAGPTPCGTYANLSPGYRVVMTP